MPSHKPTKTYEKRTRLQLSNSSKSVDAVNALFAENLTKRLKSRRKAKVKLKELPPRTEPYLTDESLKVEPNNTFDRLLKGKAYNPVKVAKVAKNVSSGSEPSKSNIHMSVTYHSPILTRRRNCRKKSSMVITDISEKTNSLDKPVTKSLSIEVEKKGISCTTLSYIKLPKIAENEIVNNNHEQSYQPIFSETFRERQAVISSTPCAPLLVKIVTDPISPIIKSDSSSNSGNLIEKSYDEIKKWEREFPELGDKILLVDAKIPDLGHKSFAVSDTTPRRSTRGRRRKKSTANETDWKLQCQPKVYLKGSDILKTPKEKGSPSKDTYFRGFSSEDQVTSSMECSKMKSMVDEAQITCSRDISEIKNIRDKGHSTSKVNVETRRKSWGRVSKRSRTSSRLPKRITKRMETPPRGSPAEVIILRRREVRRATKPTKKSPPKDVTEDILSEKEVSYTSTSSFDFTDELRQEKEVILPKKQSLTANLQDFNDFMESYYDDKKVSCDPGSVIVVSDDSPPSTPRDRSCRSLNFLSQPKRGIVDDSSRRGSEQKIIVLSNIAIRPKRSLVESIRNVFHDHSYTESAVEPPQVATPPKEVKPHSILSDIVESSDVETTPPKKAPRFRPKPIKLKPGKSYRRSLSLLKRSSVLVDVRTDVCREDCECLKCLFKTKLNPNGSRRSSQIVAIANKSPSKSMLETYARRSACYVQEEAYVVDGLLDESVRSLSLNERNSSARPVVTAKEVVLRRCGQQEVLPFEECYPRSTLNNCQKIGEGVYGEVFLYKNQNGGTSVMKVIPIEGDLIVNGERQKKFDEILSEIVIAMELSNLRNNKRNNTSNFSQVQKVRCTQGNYPDRLLDLWDLYDETRGSENDSPQMFPSNQIYVVLELANGGLDLESYVFNNALQVFAMFKQTACALAVAETQLNFEHRDLHWGNILISTVDKNKLLTYRLDGKTIEVESQGVEAAIIDFTLSRIEFDGVVIYNDLSLDEELFVAKGDYQFEIYRMMQQSNGNEWQHFEPYTNVLWLHYLLDKVPALRYKNPRSKLHKEYLTELKKMKEEMLSYNSCAEFVSKKFV